MQFFLFEMIELDEKSIFLLLKFQNAFFLFEMIELNEKKHF